MSEPIPTRESLAGFFASEPRLGTTKTGNTRLYARVGVEHWSKEPDGTFTELEPTYHDMAAYGPLAERLEGRFHKGDRFVAHGDTRVYPSARAGEDGMALEFVVRRIGHDITRTRYTVERGPTANHPAGRGSTRAVDQDAATTDVSASGSRLRTVPDLSVEPNNVRPADAQGAAADLPLGS
ncbi:single-stranded DNA-binding protein [Georgenia subflava]|uniref:Single-stranded DNA-binding protein n=1 Tax=Georgenia subflava TaxID=1622177 RepID=A0A6N7EFF5_9MICO|nr:single-stranded DNA-binding protein [Georgenia subflava]MPV35923.1 single-stranded DNA-binding protein [Georgenia subflava]